MKTNLKEFLPPLVIKSTVNADGTYTQASKAKWNGHIFAHPVINSVKPGGICHSEAQNALLDKVKEMLR